jgi:hypothetical protein
MQIKVTAEDASWSLREAVWNLEERLLWRGSDAARSRVRRLVTALKELIIRAFVRTRLAFRRLLHGRLPGVTGAVRRVTEPVLRLVETKLVWPITDRWHEHGLIAHTGVVALLAAAAIAAGITGSNLATSGDSGGSTQTENLAATAPIPLTQAQPATLEGVAPEFTPAAAANPAAAAPQAAPQPTGPGPASVAWRFSQAFVDYEIGQSEAKTAQTFAETASPVLAKALSEDPPRLPNGTPVPAARVLNVVLANETPKNDPTQVTASVSLLRVGTVSEVRLTLVKGEHDVWKVSEVLG